MLAVLLPLLLTVLATAPQEEDSVELVGGKVLEGRVMYEDDQEVVLRNGSRDRELPRAEVSGVDSRARALHELLEAAAGANSWSFEDNARMAAMAREGKLPEMERLFWWRVLVSDPESTAANEALDHKKKGSSWRVTVGRKSLTLEKAREAATDFGKAWEFPTRHFLIRSNLELEVVLDLALDLERIYDGYFQLFQKKMRLYEVEEPMPVHLHADDASFPEQSGEVGYFSTGDFTTRIQCTERYYRQVLIHEVVHQLIYFTAVRERSNSGAIPPWLDEGLAVYIASAAQGVPGKLELVPDQTDSRWFGEHHGATKPYGLSRVLNLSGGDFRATSKRDLKYAQSYTLVHFCLHGADGKYRDGFLDFVRATYGGQGSSTEFKKRLGIEDEDDFEAQWAAYVALHAG